MTELKPCPFCGEPPELFSFKDGRYLVNCVNPDCDVYPYTRIHDSAEAAAEAWNRRAL